MSEVIDIKTRIVDIQTSDNNQIEVVYTAKNHEAIWDQLFRNNSANIETVMAFDGLKGVIANIEKRISAIESPPKRKAWLRIWDLCK